MKQQLIDTLSTFGYPVVLQGSLLPDEPYPPAFFTFWNNGTPDNSHYDNKAISYVWDFSIYFYATDPELVNTILLDVKAALLALDWIVSGKGYDVPSDEKTHTGRAINALYIEYENTQEV